MVWTWRGYERKTVEYLTKERPDFSGQVLRSAWGQTESKIRFGSGPGWPKLSDGSAAIQFSISSPVIVRNRRIEPKFGLLNLSIYFSSHFPYIFPYIWHVRKTDIYNCKEKRVEISLHFSSHFATSHFPHNFPYIYFSSHFPYIFPHIWHVRKTDIYNSNVRKILWGKCQENVWKMWGNCEEISSLFPHTFLTLKFHSVGFLTEFKNRWSCKLGPSHL